MSRWCLSQKGMVISLKNADNLPRYTLRINRLTLDKISYIAGYEGRTLNKELGRMIKIRIKEFEKANGEIELDKQ